MPPKYPMDPAQMQHAPIDQTIAQFRQAYGDEQAIMLLEELVRRQGGLQHRAPGTLSEVESFGRARAYPTDANMRMHQNRFGYSPQSGTPFSPPSMLPQKRKPGGY